MRDKLSELQEGLTAVKGLLGSSFLSEATLQRLRLLKFELETDIELINAHRLNDGLKAA